MVSPCFMENNMSYRIKVQNSHGDWYQIFPDNETPRFFMNVMKEQGAVFQEDGSFECRVSVIQPVIDAIEIYIKEKQKYFNSKSALRRRLAKRKEEMDQGIYKVVPNSIFDLTNFFVPYTRRFKSGFDEFPTWRIVEMHGTEWLLFMNFNFIKFIEESIYRSSELSFKLKTGSILVIKGVNE